MGNKKLYTYALNTLKKCGWFDEIILVCHPDWPCEEEGVRSVRGGKTRQESAYFGLRGFEKEPEIVLIHDAVRPFVSEEIIKKNIEGALRWGAVDTCIPSTDTLVFAPGHEQVSSIPKREDYLRGQTPQTFRYQWIKEAHEAAAKEGISNASDDCSLILKKGYPLFVVIGEERNLKITSEFDLFLAEQYLSLK